MNKLTTAILVLAFTATALAGEKSPVERLKADNAEVELAASRELVAGGETYMKEIAAAFKALKPDQRKFRERYRDVVARIRTAQIRAWVVKLAPSLERKYKWDGLVRYLTWTSQLATPTDARRAFCLITRSTEDWSEAEGVTLLSVCLGDSSVEVRCAAVDALDREDWKKGGIDLLVEALKDKAEKVRVKAGSYLVGRGDQRGLAAVLAAVRSKDAEVRRTGLDTVRGLIVVETQQPRFKHTPEEIGVLVDLLPVANWRGADGADDWNSRGTVIRLLGMVGDKRAGKPLLDLLPTETHPKNRGRISISLGQLRHRPAAAALPAQLGRKFAASKKNYNWSAAASWGEIGDPESVPAVIEMLGSADKWIPKYAATALSYAFGGYELMGAPPTRGRPAYLLVPSAEGKLERKGFNDAPGGAELRKLWEAFWAKNKSKYKWSAESNTLRPAKEKPKAE
jgi:hypothetical protein